MNGERFAFSALLFFTATLFALIFNLQNRPAAVYAQLNATATPTLSVVELQETVNALSTQVAYQATQVGLNKEAVEVQSIKDLIPLIGLMGALSLVGLASPFVAAQVVKSETKKQLNKAMYKVDPTRFPIHVPQNGFESEKLRLKRLGFKNLRPYMGLGSSQLDGIVIFVARLDSVEETDSEKLKDIKRTSADIVNLGGFIRDNNADPSKLAFVIYTKEQIPLYVFQSEIPASFDTIVYANSSVTIAMHIYSLARLLMK